MMEDSVPGAEGAAHAPTLSRRRFLRIGCLSTAAVGLTVCGVSTLAPPPPPIELSSVIAGDKGPDDRLLVTYASFAGSTEEVALEIGKRLGERGFTVDVIPVLEGPRVEDYRSVIIGSGVYGSRWRPEALEFVEAHQAALQRVQVALFSVCLAGLAKDAETLSAHATTVFESVRPLVRPVDEALFAGKVDSRGASLFLPNGLARLFPTLDFRDWKRIHAWAQSLFTSG